MRGTFFNTFKTFVLLAFSAPCSSASAASSAPAVSGPRLGFLFVGAMYWFSDKIAVAAARPSRHP
jgi:hypothetical protein